MRCKAKLHQSYKRAKVCQQLPIGRRNGQPPVVQDTALNKATNTLKAEPERIIQDAQNQVMVNQATTVMACPLSEGDKN